MIIKKISDYYTDNIKFLHPGLRYEDYMDIMKWGFEHFNMIMKSGGDITIRNWRYIAFCGYMFRDIEKWTGYMFIKHGIKLRLNYKYAKRTYDGLYYIGLNDAEYNRYFNSPGKHRKIKFQNVTMYKILDECLLQRHKKWFYAIYYPLDIGWARKRDITTKDYKLIAYKDDHGKIIKQ